jgi:N-acetylneuraminic acid mutarotase
MFGLAALATAALAWHAAAPLPDARTEVAGAVLGQELVVAGGYTADGRSSRRVDAYSPARDHWRRLADLPVAVNHAAAAAAGTRLYVVGGFGGERRASVFVSGRWRRLHDLPSGRAAGGAAIVGAKLYVVGGLTGNGLARSMLVLDLRTGRWSAAPGPTPRQHLAVTALGGRIYALAGRIAGYDTNMPTFESYKPGARRWRRLPPVSDARGGTGVAAVGRLIVSVGGEAPAGTIARVYAFDVRARRWRRFPDLPTPRHGLAVEALGGRVYAAAGGPKPGLFVSAVNEYLPVG